MKTMPAYSSHTAITSVIKIKNNQGKWYRELTNRFGSFDTNISYLFATLAEEHEKDKQSLLQLAHRIMEEKKILLSAKNNDAQSNIAFYETVAYRDNTNHFFVISEPMATAIFDAVLASARQAQRFYEKCFMAENHYLLRTQYQRLTRVEDQHMQRLEETKKHFYAESAPCAPWPQPNNPRYIAQPSSLMD